ncbi:MAG: peptidase M14 [Acidobacteria bacterium]|nr:peptidase M14 [Acidobacteriota bacterium]
MQKVLLATATLFIFLMNIESRAQTAKDFAEIWEKHHITNILPSNVRHKDLQNYLAKLKQLGLKVDEVGRSYGNREIYQVEWGKGPTRVFLWSQMHGDEPTATSALIDMLAYLQTHGDKKWVEKFAETFTLRVVPMLNPDGTELYQRRNLQGIDINRDATNLKTPEGQLLKKLRDEWSPQIGFNLHNQQELTAAGNSTRQAAISFLAVRGTADGSSTPGYERSKRIITAMVLALNQFISGYIGRYDEDYNALAFGDNFSAWGTPVILIETGALYGKDEMFLVKMNFVAFLTALQSVADGTEAKLSPINYDQLPINTSEKLVNFVFRRATVVNFSETRAAPFVSDVAVNFERRRAEFINKTYVRDVGGLPNLSGLEEYDAAGFYLVPRFGKLRVGEPGEFLFYKKSRTVDWNTPNLETAAPPDAVFSLGKWTAGEGVVPRK